VLTEIDRLLAEIESYLLDSPEALEAFRLAYLAKKGAITQLVADFRNVPPEQKREVGQRLNVLKSLAEERMNAAKQALEAALADGPASKSDDTLPPPMNWAGARHPISMVRARIIEIFGRMGFSVERGPEIVDDWHNFEALNFPPDHPARDMQDTFFLRDSPGKMLRTHTSSVQVRVMQSQQPPIRCIMPGRVYRNETISARAHCFFHQVEGLYIDTDVSFAELKQTLYGFVQEFYGQGVDIRFRPSYFPFTEPSAEMDISCQICHGAGCSVCKHTGWVEILGCGMVHPAVLENCGIDSHKYTGFAFGMGIERLAMLQYDVNDLRHFSENDVRFLGQFDALH